MIELSVASRRYPGETLSGDAFGVATGGSWYRIALVDGLGHGPEAAHAAEQALAALTRDSELDPAESIGVCHAALRGTRGAALTVARVELTSHTVVIAGVGNVDARIRQASGETRFVPNRGIVGSFLPTIRPLEFPVGENWLLIMHTDGVASNFDLGQLVRAAGSSRQSLADEILRRYAREADDALVLVASPTTCDHQLDPSTTAAAIE